MRKVNAPISCVCNTYVGVCVYCALIVALHAANRYSSVSPLVGILCCRYERTEGDGMIREVPTVVGR